MNQSLQHVPELYMCMRARVLSEDSFFDSGFDRSESRISNVGLKHTTFLTYEGIQRSELMRAYSTRLLKDSLQSEAVCDQFGFIQDSSAFLDHKSIKTSLIMKRHMSDITGPARALEELRFVAQPNKSASEDTSGAF